MLNSQLPPRERIRAALKASAFYAKWYPRQWLPFGVAQSRNSAGGVAVRVHPRLAGHVRWTERHSRKLARTLFHAMARFGPKLERQQVLLGRFVDIGTELFAIAASCARAETLATREAIELADFFASAARLRIERLFRAIGSNTDRHGYVLAQRVVAGDFEWIEDGLLTRQ